MLREDFEKRLKELPDIILEFKGVYSLEMINRYVQLEWDPHIAYVLLNSEQKENSTFEFLRYLYHGWKITMEVPTKETL